MRDKLNAANLKTALMDHGYCYSLYTRDPNGMLVEFSADPEGIEQVFKDKAASASDELARWLGGPA